MPAYFVTGATRGIGREIALRLADNDLFLAGRDAIALRKLCAELPSARPVVVDLARPDSLHASLLEAGAPKRLDGLLHVAGVSHRGPLADFSLAAWEEMMVVNVLAVSELTRLLLPALRASRGNVLLVNSGAGLAVRGTGGAAYAATKHALRAFADGLRLEEPELRVTSLFLGSVATDMQRELRQYQGEDFVAANYLYPTSVAVLCDQLLRLPSDATIPDITLLPR